MADSPKDNFELYYAEKLWEMIPAVYRHEDGRGEKKGVLRALIEVLAEQAALLRRSHDRLWEDQSIECCDDWAVPYIGDLVGTRLVSALNPAGRRVDVAKTIHYRRRKGTLRVLEELISDIARWEGVAVENFKRLARTRHSLDPAPSEQMGRLSGTMPGGWADLRSLYAAEMIKGPFDEFYHTADIRRHRGFDGRYAIPKLAFHIYRLPAYRVEGVTPCSLGNGRFTFDPSGRDVPLFMPRNRPQDPDAGSECVDWEKWRGMNEWDLPTPMRCRLLADAQYIISESLVENLLKTNGLSSDAAADLRPLCNMLFQSESRLREFIGTLEHSAELLSDNIYFSILRGAIIDDCPKKVLLTSNTRALDINVGTPGVNVVAEKIVAGNLYGWGITATDQKVVVDPESGRLLFEEPADETVTVSYCYGFSADIGAGVYDRRGFLQIPDRDHILHDGGPLTANHLLNEGVTQLNDSATYGPVSNKLGVNKMSLQAANGQRPYLRLESDWILNTGSNMESILLLEGLWIGSKSGASIILRGDYEQVIISHSTLDPGGSSILTKDEGGDKRPAISPVQLIIDGNVKELLIQASILGPILARDDGIIEKLTIRDSVLQSLDPDSPALLMDEVEVEMKRVTVFGGMKVHRLWASEALITDTVEVQDTQTGCFRFSAAPEKCFDVASDKTRLPHPYESHPIKDSDHFFTSHRFGDPGYAQLSETCPEELRRGAESGSEIGAFSGPTWNGSLPPGEENDDHNWYEIMFPDYERMVRIVGNTTCIDSLKAKIEEYMPFGHIPIFILET